MLLGVVLAAEKATSTSTCQNVFCYATDCYGSVPPFESVDLREEGIFPTNQYPGSNNGSAGPQWAETLAMLEMIYALRASSFNSTPNFWKDASSWTRGVSTEYILQNVFDRSEYNSNMRIFYAVDWIEYKKVSAEAYSKYTESNYPEDKSWKTRNATRTVVPQNSEKFVPF